MLSIIVRCIVEVGRCYEKMKNTRAKSWTHRRIVEISC
jgi:hypothetical protein